ncbi:MAG: trehalose-phosphatase [Geobacteraceae bacterium]|nr:trehalose-phosphatase [Geobacteraceae bacterium]
MKTINRERIWFFDFDGTLSPIVRDRDRAELHPDCRKMLEYLVRVPLQHVAVLSSRKLDDLAGRMPVRGLFLGGTSGTEWMVPGGHRMILSGRPAQRLKAIRLRLVPEIQALADLPGIQVEDKKWSIALHTRHAPDASRRELLNRLESWQTGCRVRIFRGPEVHEVQFVPRISKAYGVRTLCRFMKFVPRPGTLFYAGDDENDAIAMRLVTRLGGAAITVGERKLIPASSLVADPRELAEEVSRLANLATVTELGNVKEAIP